jgi:hypothetical protein
MINFKIIKKVFLSILILPAVFIIFLILSSNIDEPKILTLENMNLNDFKTNSSLSKVDEFLVEENNQVEFNYKLIGVRSGNKDSSVVVKKGNKQFLVALGDFLEGSFELVEVNQNDALFRQGQKIYKIEKQKNK